MTKKANFYRKKLTKSQLENEGGFILQENSEKSEEQIKEKLKDKKYDLLACSFCRNMKINTEFYETFNIEVCNSCRHKNIKLITKTTCKKDFLMTDEELKYFKFILKPNPNKITWVDMHLYLFDEIQNFSLKKFGSIEKIEEQKDLRKYNLMERKKKKIRKNIKDLRRKTFIEKNENKSHKHKFIEKDGNFVCDCGVVVEQEEL